MAEEPTDGAMFIQKFKPTLIDALCGDPDFLLQHCHSSRLLTQKEYDHVKASSDPFEKTRDILDYVMRKDRNRVNIFLRLLKEKGIQEAFPKLNEPPLSNIGKKRKKIEEKQPEDDVPKVKKMTWLSFPPGSRMVTEKQLMMVARKIGSNWKQVAREVLEIPNVDLDKIVEDNPNSHTERVFNMLYLWSTKEREKASAIRLHSLLTQEEFGIRPGTIDFLLEES
ncbi:uncharacterized protein zgc:174906 isoform X2 [Neoarius graeffei]|uniref:uncharacterized protein zgc:174906 isoform X2 n=1 Tax=Neoarius graeffei TaxID=443677 RepID=UPI00298D1D2B|nr:uncharacterized protein zgc:174906 isoform X2 [Neoarius graeffei]